MKKILSVVLSIMLLVCLCASAEDDLLSVIKERGYVVVASEGTWAPWTYHDDDDVLVGFDVEIARAVCEKLGVEARFVDCPWDSLFGGLDSGRYDMIANGVEYTEERAEKFTYSDPYAYIRTALIVKGNNDKIKGFEDLKGKKTANTLSSTYAALGEAYGATTVGVDDLDQTMTLVLQGRVDATLNAEVSFYDYMAVHPEANLKVVALTEEASSVSIIIGKGAAYESFTAAVNAALRELKEEGVLSELSIKYFGSDIS